MKALLCLLRAFACLSGKARGISRDLSIKSIRRVNALTCVFPTDAFPVHFLDSLGQ